MCCDIFSDSEIQEVREFIEVSEYGLALDTVVAIIEEEKKTISSDIYSLINEISKYMKADIKLTKN